MLSISKSDIIAATLQTEPAHLTSVLGCHVCYDTTHHDVLDAF